MYILLNEKNAVSEIIPDENPVFPGVPIQARYAPAFVARLTHVPDDTEVYQNWLYDSETGVFSAPPEPEPLVETEPDPADTEALAAYIRSKRDALLAACDWTQMPDSPMDAETKAAWAAYRQELRDVPQQEGFPETVTWPEEPADNTTT